MAIVLTKYIVRNIESLHQTDQKRNFLWEKSLIFGFLNNSWKTLKRGSHFFSISYNIVREKKMKLKEKVYNEKQFTLLFFTSKARIEYLTQVLNSKFFEAYF